MPTCNECQRDVYLTESLQIEDARICANCADVYAFHCNGCAGRFLIRNGVENTRGDLFCERCYVYLHSDCGVCGCEIRNPQFRNGLATCSDCLAESEFTCPCCDDDVDFEQTTINPVGERICNTCFELDWIECTNCGDLTYTDFIRCEGNENICRNCRESATWSDRGFFTEQPTYEEIRSQRRYGVEFETSFCPDHIQIKDDTVFGCKEDGSVDGMEFVSPVLYGDEGLAEIRKLCDQARQYNWEVDSACGFHVHFDLSNESDENCFKVALAYHYTYDFWSTFISDARKRNYYCAKHFYTPSSMIGHTRYESWVSDVVAGERYNWCNLTAYLRFKTIELRNHSATLNGTKVCNWIKANTRFIDKIVTMSRAEIAHSLDGRDVYDQFNTVSGWWDDDNLTRFYRRRAELFGKPIRPTMTVGV